MSIGATYIATSRHYLRKRLEQIRHCVEQLSDEQVWWRPHPSMNSVANILLHLCGNIQQWIVAPAGGVTADRDRPAEFADRSGTGKAELLSRLESTIAEADTVLSRLDEKTLLEARRIQGFDETLLSALFDSITHLTGHMQEIVYITRQLLGDTYRFHWVPMSPEQGASAHG
jgi:uncharacterized damage-inducible protein DinB